MEDECRPWFCDPQIRGLRHRGQLRKCTQARALMPGLVPLSSCWRDSSVSTSSTIVEGAGLHAPAATVASPSGSVFCKNIKNWTGKRPEAAR